MVLKKRLSALFLALVMLLSVSVSAWAYLEPNKDYVDMGEGTLADEAFYIGDVEFTELHDAMQGIAMFRLPTDGQTRYYRATGAVTYGQYGGEGWNAPANVSLTISPAASDTTYSSYPLYSEQPTNGGYSYFIQTEGAMSYLFNSSVSISPDEYDMLTIGGNVLSYLYCTSAWGNSTRARIFPTSVEIIVNGQVVSEAFSHSSTGATLDFDMEITEQINYIGYRFNFSQGSYGNSGGSHYPSNIGLFLYCDDQGVFTLTTPPQEDPNTGLLQSIVQWIIGIYNSVFVPDSQKDDADNFQSEVSDTVAGADEVKDELDQLEKPNPEDIDTDLSDIITDDAYTQQTQIFADLLRFDKITDMLMIVFTMALISYVLFGKKG